MKKIVVLSGSGISQESGLKTFREMGGLWEEHDVTEVATPEAWENNRKLVLEFYNERRKQLLNAKPNKAHFLLAELESSYDVEIITQNVDDLHERAGSSKILHLHGELRKARSSVNPSEIYTLDGWELKENNVCKAGFPLRPHIVWFGESVPAMDVATCIVQKADMLLVVGTSLVVYPAAGLIHFAKKNTPIYVVDPNELNISTSQDIIFIKEKATTGIEKFTQMIG